MSKRLTDKQKQAVEFFRNHKKLFGHYPTFKAVGDALGIAPAVVRSRILLAEKKGVKLDRYKVIKKAE